MTGIKTDSHPIEEFVTVKKKKDDKQNDNLENKKNQKQKKKKVRQWLQGDLIGAPTGKINEAMTFEV